MHARIFSRPTAAKDSHILCSVSSPRASSKNWKKKLHEQIAQKNALKSSSSHNSVCCGAHDTHTIAYPFITRWNGSCILNINFISQIEHSRLREPGVPNFQQHAPIGQNDSPESKKGSNYGKQTTPAQAGFSIPPLPGVG